MQKVAASALSVVLCSALACGPGAGDRPASTKATRTVTAASPIQHVVVLMMENRSFDHFLGWVPGADGQQAGLTFTDGAGVPHSTFPLAPDFQGCLHPDPDHSYAGGRAEYDNGLNDGWLRAGANDVFSMPTRRPATFPRSRSSMASSPGKPPVQATTTTRTSISAMARSS